MAGALIVAVDKTPPAALQALKSAVDSKSRPCSRSSEPSRSRATAPRRSPSRRATSDSQARYLADGSIWMASSATVQLERGRDALRTRSAEQHEDYPEDDHDEEDAYPHPRLEDSFDHLTAGARHRNKQTAPAAATCYGSCATSAFGWRPRCRPPPFRLRASAEPDGGCPGRGPPRVDSPNGLPDRRRLDRAHRLLDRCMVVGCLVGRAGDQS